MSHAREQREWIGQLREVPQGKLKLGRQFLTSVAAVPYVFTSNNSKTHTYTYTYTPTQHTQHTQQHIQSSFRLPPFDLPAKVKTTFHLWNTQDPRQSCGRRPITSCHFLRPVPPVGPLSCLSKIRVRGSIKS